VREVVWKGGERRQRERCEFGAPRNVSEYVADVWDARIDLEREVLQLWVEEEVEVVEPVRCLDTPDERAKVGKNVGTRTVFIDDREDRGRYALGAFVIDKAPDALTILDDLLPVFRGRCFSLCLRCKD